MSKDEKIAIVAEKLAKGLSTEKIIKYIEEETDWGISQKTIENYIAEAKKLGDKKGDSKEAEKKDPKTSPAVNGEVRNNAGDWEPSITGEKGEVVVITGENLVDHFPIGTTESSSEYEERIFKTLNLKRDSEAQTITEKYPWINESYVSQISTREIEVDEEKDNVTFIEGETEKGKEAAASIGQSPKSEKKAAKKEKKALKKTQQSAEKETQKLREGDVKEHGIIDITSKKKKGERETSKYYQNPDSDFVETEPEFDKEDEIDRENIEVLIVQAEALLKSIDVAIDYRRSKGGISSISRLVGLKRTVTGLNKSLR